MELTSTFLLYRGLVHHHHRTSNLSSIHTLLLYIYLTCLSLFSSIHTLLLSIYLTCLIFIFLNPHSSPFHLSYMPIFTFFHPHSSPFHLSYLPIFIFFHPPIFRSIYLTCLSLFSSIHLFSFPFILHLWNNFPCIKSLQSP